MVSSTATTSGEDVVHAEGAKLLVSGIILLVMVAFYQSMGNVLRAKKSPFGHEASFTVIVGGLISLLIHSIG